MVTMLKKKNESTSENCLGHAFPKEFRTKIEQIRMMSRTTESRVWLVNGSKSGLDGS